MANLQENPLFSDSFLTELAEQITPPIEQFEPTPFKSAQLQRQAQVDQIKEALRLEDMRQQLQIGVESLFVHLEELPEKHRQNLQEELSHLCAILLAGEAPTWQPSASEPFINFAKVLGLSEATIMQIYGWALQELQNGQYTTAKGLYTLLVLLGHNVSAFWLEYGVTCFFEGSLEQAINALQSALQIWSDFPEAYLYLAQCLAASGQQQQARSALQAAQQLLQRDRAKASLLQELQEETVAAVH